jgi:cytochrome P450
VVQVALAASNRYLPTPRLDRSPREAPDDLELFRPQRHLEGGASPTLLPFGGGERVCLGKALAELEIRLMAVGLLRQGRMELAPDQDLSLQLLPSPSPRSGLWVQRVTAGRANGENGATPAPGALSS